MSDEIRSPLPRARSPLLDSSPVPVLRVASPVTVSVRPVAPPITHEVSSPSAYAVAEPAVVEAAPCTISSMEAETMVRSISDTRQRRRMAMFRRADSGNLVLSPPVVDDSRLPASVTRVVLSIQHTTRPAVHYDIPRSSLTDAEWDALFDPRGIWATNTISAKIEPFRLKDALPRMLLDDGTYWACIEDPCF
jgi:hypothetical protein